MRRSLLFLLAGISALTLALILKTERKSSPGLESPTMHLVGLEMPGAQPQGFLLEDIADLFPFEGLEQRIEFWRSVYADYGDRDSVFHDRNDLGLIYDVVSFEKSPYEVPASERRRQFKALESHRTQLESVFGDLMAEGRRAARKSDLHRKVSELLEQRGYSLNPPVLKKLQGNIRYQRGIRERFQRGIVRSGRYLDEMERIFVAHGLPTELTLLPHVESSFNYRAYSKVGAAGIWQFMPATARDFMSVGDSIDERLSPLKATEAAARFLKENHEVLGSWPLAVTAYNHGRGGIWRAKKQFGSDLSRIIENYQSGSFGFASQNFYAEFLAAVEVAKNHQKYFGELELDSPLEFDVIPIKRSLHVSHFEEVPLDLLRDYNPELTSKVWSRKMIPSGFELRVPVQNAPVLAAKVEKALSRSQRLEPTSRRTVYRVRSGDSLYTIARRFGTSAETLRRANGIRNPRRIRPGQVLAISK